MLITSNRSVAELMHAYLLVRQTDRDRLCGVDRDRSRRYRGARHLAVRRAGDAAAASLRPVTVETTLQP